MAFTCQETADGRKSTEDDNGRKHVRKFRIWTDNKSIGSYTAMKSARSASPIALPSRFDVHPEDSYALCRTVECEPGQAEKTGKVFVAVANYDTAVDETQSEPNPLLRPVKYRLEWASYQTVAERDNQGSPIVNSAGFQYDPPYMVDDDRPVLVAVKNEAASLFAVICARAIYFRRAVNTSNFFGAGSRQAKVESIVTGDVLVENNVRFYAVTTRVQFNELTWDLALLDRGTKHLDADGNVVRPVILDGPQKGQPLNDAVNLNPDGTRKTDGVGQFKRPFFRNQPERDFAGLGIGT